MAIKTTLQTRYVIRSIGMSIACIVLGLWGVYDYAIKIPREMELYTRLEVCQAMKSMLETSTSAPDYAEKRETAASLVAASVETTKAHVREEFTPEQLQEKAQAMQFNAAALREIDADGRLQWFISLYVFGQSLAAPPPLSTTNFTGVHGSAHTLALGGVGGLEGVKKVGAFDRATQWAFIACLPFALYIFWQFARERRRVYTLDDDGTLTAPEGSFSADQIVDIDMSRWMSKSIAKVKTSGNTTVVLDDYVFKHAEEIVGELAHRFYPDDWTTEAKRVEAEVEDDSDEGEVDEDFAAEADVHGDERNN